MTAEETKDEGPMPIAHTKDVIEVSSDWYQKEPLAYLVGNYNNTVEEYELFKSEPSATKHADKQYEIAREAGCPELEFPVFEMYAATGQIMSVVFNAEDAATRIPELESQLAALQAEAAAEKQRADEAEARCGGMARVEMRCVEQVNQLLESTTQIIQEANDKLAAAEERERGLREAAAKAEDARIDAEEARLRAEMLSDDAEWREAAEWAVEAMQLARTDLCQWRQLGHYQRKQSPCYSRDPLCATDAGMAQTEEAIAGIGVARAKLAALLAPAGEVRKPVVLPNPDLAYKAVMARSEQMKSDGEVRDAH